MHLLRSPRTLLFLLMLGWCAAHVSASAQETRGASGRDTSTSLYVGLSVGGSLNFHSGGFRPTDNPGCPILEDGTGSGYGIGVTAELPIDLNRRVTCMARMTWEERPADFSTAIGAKVLIPQPGPTVFDDTIGVFSADVTYTLLNIDLLGSVRLLSLGDVQFGAVLGPSLQYFLSDNSFIQLETRDTSSNPCFQSVEGAPLESDHTYALLDGSIPHANTVRFSLKGGLRCRIPLPDTDWRTMLGVYYDYGLTNVTASDEWSLHSVLGYVGIECSL